MRRAVARVESFLLGHEPVKQPCNTYNKIDNDVDPEKCWPIFLCYFEAAFDAYFPFCDTFVSEPDKCKPDD